jgi:hypothetical protein
MMQKTCIACGMPMESAKDFAMGDDSKDYCKFCCRPDGSMQSYDEKFESFTKFIVKTQGLDEKSAKDVVREILAELPAWENYKS